MVGSKRRDFCLFSLSVSLTAAGLPALSPTWMQRSHSKTSTDFSVIFVIKQEVPGVFNLLDPLQKALKKHKNSHKGPSKSSVTHSSRNYKIRLKGFKWQLSIWGSPFSLFLDKENETLRIGTELLEIRSQEMRFARRKADLKQIINVQGEENKITLGCSFRWAQVKWKT